MEYDSLSDFLFLESIEKAFKQNIITSMANALNIVKVLVQK